MNSLDNKVLLKVEGLKKHYPVKKFMKEEEAVRALDGVDFELFENETLAVVGESGCGKSTLAKVLMQLEPRTEGVISLDGSPTSEISLREYRRKVQMIFQDPYGSLNPRKRLRDIIAEPLVINANLPKAEVDQKVEELMQAVGLRFEYGDRYPHMLSGGQRQRIGIARALILNPRILICDEPVSALDISIQAQVLNLLTELQDTRKLSYIFISHDLSVVKHIAHRVVVMYLGKIVEMGTREQVFQSPRHPYTRALLASTPQIGAVPGETILRGEMPSPLKPIPGCPFHKRCPEVLPNCHNAVPEPRIEEGRHFICHL